MLATQPDLIQRVERAEALLQRRWAEAVGSAGFDYPGAHSEIAGVTCVDKGPDWLWSRAFTAGRDTPISVAAVTEIEHWFGSLGENSKPAKFDLSPIAHPSLQEVLGLRGYRPAFWDSVMLRHADSEPAEAAPSLDHIQVAPVGDSEADALAWGEMLTTSFAAGGPPEDLHDRMAHKLAAFALTEGVHCLIARIEGRPVGGGLVAIIPTSKGPVGLLHAAGTLPEFRGRGVQTALATERIRLAADAGCAVVCAQCDPRNFASMRNLHRLGFTVALSRVCMEAPMVAV